MITCSASLDHRAIQQRAAAWLARRDSGKWTREDQTALTEWLNEATAHRVAFLRLETVWEEARRAQALSAGLPAGSVPPPLKWRLPPFFAAAAHATSKSQARPIRSCRWAIAATLLLIVGAGTSFSLLHSRQPGSKYSTAVGRIATIPLADGSIVTLNTASRIRVDLQPKERLVYLEQGEAYFVVVKDRGRPFVVVAGDTRVVDVGTQFSVRRNADSLRIVVAEGTVRLESTPGSNRSGGDGAGTEVLRMQTGNGLPLSAGTIARVHDGDLLVETEPIRSVLDLVSWRKGYLTFHDTTLADAVAQFNRYNDRQITIGDSRLAGLRISGTFRPTNYEAFVRLLHDGYSIEASDVREGIVLSEN